MKRHGFKTAFVIVAALAGLAGGCGDSQTSPTDNGMSDTSANDTVVTDSPVRLNELDCHGRDWIEIVNAGDSAVDVSGWYVTDSLSKTDHYYKIPDGSVIEPGSYLVFRAATDTKEGFPFGIKCESDSVYLLDGSQKQVDKTENDLIPDGYTWGRFPDMNGSWQVTLPTQASANIVTPGTPDDLFDPKKVNSFEITLSEAAVAALKVSPYDFVSGTLTATVGGETVTNVAVGIRLKSGFSFQPLTGKAAFKVRAVGYAPGDRVFGLKNITLNNMVDDQTMMHETLAYKIFRSAGIPAPRTGYASVKVNGEDYGLYVVIEGIDDQFVATNFSSTQHLYEGTTDLYAGELDKFDIEDGSSSDTQDLAAFVATIANSSSPDWFTEVGKMADLEKMAAMWAVEHYIGHSDGYSLAANNYFLHSSNDGVFTMIPWGTDRSFVDKPPFYACSGTLCSTCMGIDDCKALYIRGLSAVPALVTQLGLESLVSEIETVISAYVESDPRRPYTVEDHTAAVDALKAYISARSADVN